MALRMWLRRGRARSVIALACVLGLLWTMSPARAEDSGGDELTKWSWETFFDYASCGIAVASTIPTGGTTILLAAVTCGRALVLHLND